MFGELTLRALQFACARLGLDLGDAARDTLVGEYRRLPPFAENEAVLRELKSRGVPAGVLSNGDPGMLDAVISHAGFAPLLDATLSVDAAKIYKPSPKAYALVEQSLGVGAAQVVFVSSNPFDVSGAKAFGFKVAWIERVSAAAIAGETRDQRAIGPLAMFKATRLRPDPFGFAPDWTIRALSELPALLTGARAG